MFTLVFGLTRYYSKSYNDIVHLQPSMSGTMENSQNGRDNKVINGNQVNESTASARLFIAIFAILLIICAFGTKVNSDTFTPWNNIDWFGAIQLAAAIAISFFIPGYAILLIIGKSSKLTPVPRVLLAYLFSMLITGLSVYIARLLLRCSGPYD